MPVTLTLLRIKNLALVEELDWQIGPGFVAVTGETGAGKSIIIGALQLLLGERADRGAAQRHDMSKATERAAHVAGECPHIGPLAALRGEHAVIGVGCLDQFKVMDLDRARREFHHLALAGEIVGALAVDLDGGEARRHLSCGLGRP